MELVVLRCNCGGGFGRGQFVEERQLPCARRMFGVEKHRRRPGLLIVAHGMSAAAMQPLVERPIGQGALAVGFGQGDDHLLGLARQPVAHQRGHVETADHGPDAAVVILVGQVQIAAAVIVAPVAFPGEDRRVDGLGRVGFSHAHLLHVPQDMLRAMPVGHAGEHRQQVAQAVAPVAIFAERDPGQIEGAAGDGADVVIEHEPFQADRLEPFQMLRKVLRHPAAVDPEQQVEPLVDIGRVDAGLVAGRRRGLKPRQFFMRQLGGVIKHIVIEHVVAHRQQIHPVARLRDLHQPALVHVLIIEPEHGAVDGRPVGVQKRQIAGVVIVEKVAEDEPEVGIDGAGIFSGNMTAVRVHVERDQPTRGLVGAERCQRRAPRVQECPIAGDRRPQEGDDAVPRPNLRIPRRQRRRPEAMGRHALVQNIQGPDMGLSE